MSPESIPIISIDVFCAYIGGNAKHFDWSGQFRRKLRRKKVLKDWVFYHKTTRIRNLRIPY
jgi:hypothetical protein